MFPQKRSINFIWPPRRVRIQQMLATIILSTLLIVSTFALILFFYGRHQCTRYLPMEVFKWPPYIDVRAEVERQLLGEQPHTRPINDWANFKILIDPNCTGWDEEEAEGREILLLVKSAPSRIEERDAIRATFGSFNGTRGYRIRTVFVMGSMLEWRTNWMARLRAEARTWGDLLVGDHQDDYFHSCFKLANAIKLARHFCGRKRAVPFIMLLDDDYVMFPWELIKEVQRHSPRERLYEGFCYFQSNPYRESYNKWAVTYREYPFEKYPDYCTGGTVLLSQKTIEEFYIAIQHSEFFVWEDVYTGILARLLNIAPQHNPKFFGKPKKEKPLLLNCHGADRDWPVCKNWHDVISAHGYSPEEIRQIYGQIWRRWWAKGEEEEKMLRQGEGRTSPRMPSSYYSYAQN